MKMNGWIVIIKDSFFLYFSNCSRRSSCFFQEMLRGAVIQLCSAPPTSISAFILDSSSAVPFRFSSSSSATYVFKCAWVLLQAITIECISSSFHGLFIADRVIGWRIFLNEVVGQCSSVIVHSAFSLLHSCIQCYTPFPLFPLNHLHYLFSFVCIHICCQSAVFSTSLASFSPFTISNPFFVLKMSTLWSGIEFCESIWAALTGGVLFRVSRMRCWLW